MDMSKLKKLISESVKKVLTENDGEDSLEVQVLKYLKNKYPLYTEDALLGQLIYTDKTPENKAEYDRIFKMMQKEVNDKWNLHGTRDAFELVEEYVTGFLEQEYGDDISDQEIDI
jgi:hypothetical protein